MDRASCILSYAIFVNFQDGEGLQNYGTLSKNPYLEYEYEGFINLKVSICFLYFNIYFYSKFLETLKSSLFFDIFKVYNYKKGFEV